MVVFELVGHHNNEPVLDMECYTACYNFSSREAITLKQDTVTVINTEIKCNLPDTCTLIDRTPDNGVYKCLSKILIPDPITKILLVPIYANHEITIDPMVRFIHVELAWKDDVDENYLSGDFLNFKTKTLNFLKLYLMSSRLTLTFSFVICFSSSIVSFMTLSSFFPFQCCQISSSSSLLLSVSILLSSLM